MSTFKSKVLSTCLFLFFTYVGLAQCPINPTVQIKLSSDSVCAPATVTLTMPVTGADPTYTVRVVTYAGTGGIGMSMYQYYTGNGNGTVQTYTNPGTYVATSNVTLTSPTSTCFTSTSRTITILDNNHIKCNPVGLKENTSGEELLLFPQPTNGKFSLSNVQASTEVMLIDAFGKMIYSWSTEHKGQFEIPAEVADGVYYLQFTTGDRLRTEKLILVR